MNRTILVIDDSWIARYKIVEIVRQEEYEVLEAPSGAEGLTRMKDQAPDVVLLDLLMPEMSGLDVLKEMRRQDLFIPVIVVTADIQETTKEECLQEGAVSIINKPPRPKELLRDIKAALNMGKE